MIQVRSEPSYSPLVTLLQTLVSNVGTMVSMPLFHHFNVNDNLIILISGVSCILSRVTRALAKTEQAFLASSACGVLLYIFSAPIRAQMTR